MMGQWSPSGNWSFENLDRVTLRQRIYRGGVLGENWKFKKEEL